MLRFYRNVANLSKEQSNMLQRMISSRFSASQINWGMLKDCLRIFHSVHQLGSTQHNLQSDLSLQIHRRISVRVPLPPVQTHHHGDPRSLALGQSATKRARYLRSAMTSLQGRESSKASTYVTLTIRR